MSRHLHASSVCEARWLSIDCTCCRQGKLQGLPHVHEPCLQLLLHGAPHHGSPSGKVQICPQSDMLYTHVACPMQCSATLHSQGLTSWVHTWARRELLLRRRPLGWCHHHAATAMLRIQGLLVPLVCDGKGTGPLPCSTVG